MSPKINVIDPQMRFQNIGSSTQTFEKNQAIGMRLMSPKIMHSIFQEEDINPNMILPIKIVQKVFGH